jgi:hypothetical protein|tara:strand:+ start:720 stop:1205 length:486 start_codon:yes stop_codon:yes gene_type:complete
VKRHSVLIYGNNHDALQWQIFNIFAAEHRCFMKDRLATPWGASVLDRKLSSHPSIKKTLYTPVDIIIITKLDDHYFMELMNEIEVDHPSIKVIILDPEGKEQTDVAIEKHPNVSISYCSVKSPDGPEDLYFYDEPLEIESTDDKEFWTNFFQFSLFKVEIV